MLRVVFLIMIALAGCFHEGGDTEVAPAEELPVVEYPCPNFDRGDWILLVELPRENLTPEKFRMVNEWIDPITQAYVDGKDFLFVIFKPGVVLQDGTKTLYHLRSARFYLEAPGLLDLPAQSFHFPDPDGIWFRYWGNYSREGYPNTGFAVLFDSGHVDDIDRKYFWSPQFGTSFRDDYTVGFNGPEIKAGWVLRIYIR